MIAKGCYTYALPCFVYVKLSELRYNRYKALCLSQEFLPFYVHIHAEHYNYVCLF